MSERSLFAEDEAYAKQEEQVTYMEKVNATLKFLKYIPEVNCCQNCKNYDDGTCLVMNDYGGPAFEPYAMGKCRHYSKRNNEEE